MYTVESRFGQDLIKHYAGWDRHRARIEFCFWRALDAALDQCTTITSSTGDQSEQPEQPDEPPIYRVRVDGVLCVVYCGGDLDAARFAAAHYASSGQHVTIERIVGESLDDDTAEPVPGQADVTWRSRRFRAATST